MHVVARRKKWARWLALAAVVAMPLLCLHFWWEGWHSSPAEENAVVARMARNPNLSQPTRAWLQRWPGFLAASGAARERAGDLAKVLKVPGWVYVPVVEAQQKTALVMPTFGAFAVVLCAWLWLSRVRATDAGLLLPRKHPIPWADIREIDVSRWQSGGTVRLAHVGKAGGTEAVVLSSRNWDGIPDILAAVDRYATQARVIQPDGSNAG